jgi:(S)-2-hydroxyglutarate dehydrogenase
MLDGPMENEVFDVVVVGAGILGLALARELGQSKKRLRVAVLEKENRIAEHQTGHNSGVIHSGIYYSPGSLKAKLCTRGSALLSQYCLEHGIHYESCGKVIVATKRSDLPRMDGLYHRGLANGISGLERLGPGGLAEIEPNVFGLAALYVPSTGIVDYRSVACSLADDFVRLGGSLQTSTPVSSIHLGEHEARVATSTGTTIRTRFVVTCGGLQADRLAAMTNGPRNPKIVPFRGSYYVLGGGAERLVNGLVYPVPDPALPFLGVHFTRRVSGEVWAGPNAVLALGREAYRRRDVRLRELLETLTYPGLISLACAQWRAGLRELGLEFSRRRYAAALRELVPEIEPKHLLRGPTGVRAQALAEDGRLLDDFWIDEAPRAIHVRNAPSPGATSSLALALELATRVHDALRAEKRRTSPTQQAAIT